MIDDDCYYDDNIDYDVDDNYNCNHDDDYYDFCINIPALPQPIASVMVMIMKMKIIIVISTAKRCS